MLDFCGVNGQRSSQIEVVLVEMLESLYRVKMTYLPVPIITLRMNGGAPRH